MCEAELAAYNNALLLYHQAQANVTTAAALVNLTWQAYQNCLAGQGGGMAPGRVAQKAKPKRKRK